MCSQCILFYRAIVFSCLVVTLLNVRFVQIFLLSGNTEKGSPARCTCDHVPDIVGTSVLDVTPSNLVCVDKRAPALLYPLAIPDLKQLVLNLINNETVGVARINEGYTSVTFPPVPLYFYPLNPVGLVILIKSATGNVANRDAYRSAWANPEYLSKFGMPIVHAFLIGSGQYFGSIPEELRNESVMHKDVIFEDFVETYRNNTYKTLGGFKWALEMGPEFEFLVMIDDDLYFSVEQAVRFLKYPHLFNVKSGSSVGSKFGIQIPAEQSFYASSKIGGYEAGMPERDSGVKNWYVSWEDYPFEKFPHYPAGMTTFYSRAAITELYAASPYVKHLNVDDAYVGIIAAKLGLELKDLKPYIRNDLDSDWVQKPSMDIIRQLIAWHIPVFASKRLAIWHEVHGNDSKH